MTNELGISFSPFGDPNDPNNRREGGGGVPTPQDAIRVLSFRPPRTVGAFSPIPGPLLNAPGGAAFGGSGMGLEQLLMALFGPMAGNQFRPGGRPGDGDRPNRPNTPPPLVLPPPGFDPGKQAGDDNGLPKPVGERFAPPRDFFNLEGRRRA